MSETLILAFDGSTVLFHPLGEALLLRFRWAEGCKISGKRPVPDRIHYIARLNHNDLPILGPPSYVFDLPLLYGLRYNDGNLAYKFELSDISVLESPGTFNDDWPYRDYPTLLPYIPLTVAKRKKQTWQQFAAEFPNMKDEQPSDLVVIVLHR